MIVGRNIGHFKSLLGATATTRKDRLLQAHRTGDLLDAMVAKARNDNDIYTIPDGLDAAGVREWILRQHVRLVIHVSSSFKTEIERRAAAANMALGDWLEGRCAPVGQGDQGVLPARTRARHFTEVNTQVDANLESVGALDDKTHGMRVQSDERIRPSTTTTFENVWDALCSSAEDAREMDIKGAIFDAIQKELRGRDLTPAVAADFLGMTLDEVKLMSSGCPDVGSIGRMIVIAGKLGLGVSAQVQRPRTTIVTLEEARARAIARGETRDPSLLKQVPMMSAAAVRRALAVSTKVLDKMIVERAILMVPEPAGRKLFPTFQFSQAGPVIDGFKEVMDALPIRNPFSIVSFFMQPLDLFDLERPIDVLRVGRRDEVVEVAKTMFEHVG